jgi:hypothetical protein
MGYGLLRLGNDRQKWECENPYTIIKKVVVGNFRV